MLRGKGAAAFKEVLQSSLSLFDFIWASHIAGREFETPEARASVIKTLRNQVNAIADRDVQSHYQALLSDKVSETFFARRQDRARPLTSGLRLRKPGKAAALHTRILTASVINHPHIFDQVEEQFTGHEIQSPELARLRDEMILALEKAPDLDSAGLQDHLKNAGFTKEMDDILSESVYVHAAFCSPKADPESVAGQWLEFWGAIQGQVLKQEIQSGWKDAFHHSNEDEEEKLRAMIQIKAADSA